MNPIWYVRVFGSQLWKAGFALLLFGGMAGAAHAQKTAQVIDSPIPYKQIDPGWQDCGLRKIDQDVFESRRLSRKKTKRKTATIEVDYGSGFTTRAREAFERAVEVWEASIESSVTIRVQATFEELESGVLGGAGPNFVYAVDTNGDDELDTVFGDALVDALTGQDQQEGEPDIVARFNKERDDWHYGEEDAPSGTIDFTSVVLHEIGHGLNYFDVTDVDSEGVGEYGTVDFNNAPDGIPSIFTRFLAKKNADGSLTAITNESAFPNPSKKLGDALTSDALVYDADSSRIAANQSTGPTPPKIYAPSSYDAGSSIAHLDERTYDPEGPNSLMTPRINTAETNRLPGPVVCGQLLDMGWSSGGECLRYFRDVFGLEVTEAPDTTQGQVTLSWGVRDNADIEEYVIERRYFDGSFQPVKRIDPSMAPPVTIDSLGVGQFDFRVRWVRSDGSKGTTVQTVEVTSPPKDLNAELIGRDKEGRGTVAVTWSVPPGTQELTYLIERGSGNDESFRRVGVGENRRFEEKRVTPGRYRYRVVAEDNQGNQVASSTAAVEISFDGEVFVAGPYPQPVQDQAEVVFTARESQKVTIEVYDAVGQQIYSGSEVLGEEEATPLVFDTRDWASGMYFLRVDGPRFTTTQKIVVVH